MIWAPASTAACALDEEIDAHVARSVAFFLAACRHGSVS